MNEQSLLKGCDLFCLVQCGLYTVVVKNMSPVDIELLFVISYNITALHDNLY